ncbi:MAG: pantoate--beta-alanine ligase, partial [Ferruginibacter sp.]
MVILKKAEDIRHFLLEQKQQQASIGFCPTMGALHAGHLSLIEASKRQCSLTVCSIFINPTQFNNPSDYQQYPVSLEQDIQMLEAAGCDLLFLPEETEMYPNGIPTQKYDLGFLDTIMEGAHRPGHYQGVCMVVHRLLSIIPSDRLFLGEKDYQQCMVIQRLIELESIPVRIEIQPTIRERNGLAMSSRNRRLNEGQQKRATVIYAALMYMKDAFDKTPTAKLLENAENQVTQAGLTIDYITLYQDTLEPLQASNN